LEGKKEYETCITRNEKKINAVESGNKTDKIVATLF
jgi:hypothetical protein